jgi:hypothetical protein
MAGLGDILGKGTATPPAGGSEPVVPPTEPTTPPAGTGTPTEPKGTTDTPPTPPPTTSWLEEVSKLTKTEFKTPEDFGKYFERSKKIDEYEPKIKEFETKEKQYKEQVETLQSSLNPLSYFSTPEAYVAEQLRRQYPDKSPSVLQEIVSRDTKGVADVEVLVKNKLLETPDLIGGESGARELVYNELGIDGDTPEAEWTNLTKNKIKTQAKDIRMSWDELKSKVELPKVLTADEIALSRKQKLQATLEAAKPAIDQFSKFDHFTEEIEEGKTFDFIVPDEYKQSLPDMIKAAIEAGIEPTAENMAVLHEQKEALMLRRNFKQIYKIIEADVETKLKAEEDKRNGNIPPPNTTKATESELARQKFSKEHGIGKLLDKK